MKVIDTGADARQCRVAIVASRFNSFVVDRLLEGCIRTLRSRGVPDGNVTLIRVPGAFEIPTAVRALADDRAADAVIALGAVIRGETAHFEYIAGECARGLGSIAATTGLPVIFGVLTVDNAQQALDRSGDDESNKGSEAAAAALDMIGIVRGIRS